MAARPKNHKAVYGRRVGGMTVLDRTRPFDGTCEACGAKDDLRPYGAGGEWICFDCAKKNPEVAEKRMGQVLFHEGLH